MSRAVIKRLHHLCGKAIDEWKMISHKDRILVGVSGGRDSLTLLHLLARFKRIAPVEFEIFPVHIDPGFEDGFATELKAYLGGMSEGRYPDLHVEYTDFGVLAHSGKIRENPCFSCSRLRRKRLFELAKVNDCRKIALGHNKDDLIETLFINI